MIRVLHYTPTRGVRIDLTTDQLTEALAQRDSLIWVDFENTPPESDEPILRDVFGFHPLAIDDALQETHVPKIDDWENYLYIVLQSVSLNGAGNIGDLTIEELDVFIGPDYLVTHHNLPIPAIEHLWNAVQRDDRFLKNGSDALLYRLVDEVVAGYMPLFETLDDAIDKTEAELFNHPTPDTLEQIFAIKSTLVHLRRVISPQREVLNKLARDDYKVIDARARIYFRDVYDHLVRQYEIAESLRDLISGSLDTYLSVVNNRMNEIMKTLTIITTIFMPLAFIASFFGMNFFAPAAVSTIWTGYPAFLFTLALTAATPICMYLWMRRRGWF